MKSRLLLLKNPSPCALLNSDSWLPHPISLCPAFFCLFPQMDSLAFSPGMISNFSFPSRVRFGAGALRELPRYLAALGLHRPLIVTDPGLISTDAFKSLGKISGGKWAVFSGVHPNPTIEDVDAATKAYQENRCDSVIAFGGGSALDVGKVIRLCVKRPGQPLIPFDYDAYWTGRAPCITIPTTAGTGSEVGRSSVIIKDGRKRVVFHPALLASLVILDPE